MGFNSAFKVLNYIVHLAGYCHSCFTMHGFLNVKNIIFYSSFALLITIFLSFRYDVYSVLIPAPFFHSPFIIVPLIQNSSIDPLCLSGKHVSYK